MVVGSGMIAKRFYEYVNDDRFIIFASGVSNSSTKEKDAFEREKNLLLQTGEAHPDKRLVYFSTCSIYDDSLTGSLYVQHKLLMETLVAKHSGGYTIFRVSNPVGNTQNKHTLLNFFIYALLHHQPFTVYSKAERNLMDIDDMYRLCHFILQQSLFINGIVNIANPVNYPVLYIISTLEAYFSTQANITIKDKHSVPEIDTTAIQPLYKQLNISFGAGYLLHLLQKYYPLT
jgi:nucleoside-diphosphate-sugar epimerase